MVGADVRDVPLPLTPYRVVANPPFGHTAAILHRLLDDPAGGWCGPISWCSGRSPATGPGSSEGAPADLLGATWGPWWRFARGRRLPAACFRPRPSVDAAVLVITRREPAAPRRPSSTLRGLRAREFAAEPRPAGRGGRVGRAVPRAAVTRPGLHSRAVECQHGLALGYPEC